MKRVIGLVIFLLAGALVMIGCGGETAISTQAPTAAPPTPEPAAAEVVEEDAATDTAVSASPHDPYNLTLIGTTGRPQFLNTYASW